MKTKISKILGVGLVLLMVVSLFGVFAPVKEAQAADSAWSTQTIPSGTGQVIRANSNVTGLAVASDGLTIYAIDNVGAGAILRSANGGRTFTVLANPGGAYFAPPRLIAVAPDDPNVVAVVDSTAAVPGTNAFGLVFITSNGGITWSQLPVVPNAGVTAASVLDVKVGPARAGTLLGRDYLVAVANDTAPAVNSTRDGQMWIIGAGATWAAVGGPALSTYDYTSVAFSPNFIGDRAIVGVGSDNATGTYLVMVNQNTGLNIVGPTLIQATPLDYDAALGGGGAYIITSDIALPIDFDPTAGSGRRVWVGMAAQLATGNTDVFRIDSTTPRKLQIAVDVDINSISYSGVIAGGSLFAGERDATGTATAGVGGVWYTNDPQASFPTWTASSKPPTSDAVGAGRALTIVAVAPDYQTSKRVYAGTSDTGASRESALSWSNNGGVSFNQISLIDTTISGLSDVMVTPDGKTVFLATWNNAVGLSLESLWKSPVPTSSSSWERVRVSPATWANALNVAGTSGSIVRLNPDYATAPVLYWANVGAVAIQYSGSGGDTFAARNSMPANIIDMVVESGTVVYAAAGTAVYKSINAAWTFGLPTGTGLGANVYALAMAPSYPNLPVAGNLLVGCAGAAIAYSTNSAASFTTITGGLAGATNTQVVADTGYATNNTIYAASATGGQGIGRFVIGTSTAFDNIQTPATADVFFGLAAANKALYGAYETTGTPTGVQRSIGPTGTLGDITFENMNTGIPAAALFDAVPSSLRIDNTTSPILWAINTNLGTLMAQTDTLATVKPELTGPADATAISVDPVTGRADIVILTWKALGAGSGLVNRYQIQIAEKGTGFASAFSVLFGSAAPADITVISLTNPQLTVGATGLWNAGLAASPITLEAGRTYEWRVRARAEVSGEGLRSGWSAVRSFSIEAGTGAISPTQAGPILQAPTPGAMGVSLTPGFAWAPISGAAKYEFELSKSAATTARGYFIDALVGLTGTNALVTPGWQCDKTLDYGTSYFWHVKAITAAGAESIWGTAQFATITAGVFTCPLDGLTFATQAELQAHNAAAHAPVIPQTPAYIWAVVIIGAILVIVVIALIFTTRRVP